MRQIATVFLFTILAGFVLFLIPNDSSAKARRTAEVWPVESSGQGTAIIMTGAAARIPQQAALLEELFNRGLLKDVVFISGVSAGAINAVALNGIIEGKITWNDYRELLFGIKNDDIFKLSDDRKLPVDTEPVRILLKSFVEGKLNYYKIGDLPVTTAISFTRRQPWIKKDAYRMCSRKINEETDTTLRLVDIIMASAAIPFAFPPQRIEDVNTIPDRQYIDGGAGIDYVPFHALLEFQKFRGESVKRVYIISRKTELGDVGEELKVLGIENRTIDRFGNSFDNLLKKHLINRLTAFAREAPDMIVKSYVYIPGFNQDFLMFNFSNLKEQYIISKSWAQANDPVPLGDYLLYNKLAKREK